MSQAAPRRRFSLPAWCSAAHVVVRAELAYWRTQHLDSLVNWVLVLLGLLALNVLLFVGSVAFLFSVAIQDMGPILFVLWLLASALTALLELALCGLASGLSATAIAREREAGTWAVLRQTPLTVLEIVGGKGMAVFHFLRRPLQWALLGRAIGLGLNGLLWLYYYAKSLDPGSGGFMPGLPVLIWGGIGVFTLLGSFLPLLGMAYYGAVGLCASVFAHSRGTAVSGMALLHAVLGSGAVAGSVLVFSWGILNDSSQFWLFVALLGLAWIVLQALSAVALFAFTLHRAQRLTD